LSPRSNPQQRSALGSGSSRGTSRSIKRSGSSGAQACSRLDTLDKAVTAGFDDVARLRNDPRLNLLRDRQKPEIERLVADAVAAGQAEIPAETAGQGTP
jgi:hypothetical protein